jgi:hypothetical protein
MWTSFFFDVDCTSVSFVTFDCSVVVIPPVVVLSMILIDDVSIAGVFCNERLPHILVYDAIEDESTIDLQSRLNNDLEFLNN